MSDISTDYAKLGAAGIEGAPMTTFASSKEHMPDRPAWKCRACSLPWPCADARAGLLVEYRGYPSLLSLYMSAQMGDAMNDIGAVGGVAFKDFYERFLLWVGGSDSGTTPSEDAPLLAVGPHIEERRPVRNGRGQARLRAAPAVNQPRVA